MGHFRVPRSLTFRTRLRTKPFFFISKQAPWLLIKGFALSLALKQRLGTMAYCARHVMICILPAQLPDIPAAMTQGNTNR